MNLCLTVTASAPETTKGGGMSGRQIGFGIAINVGARIMKLLGERSSSTSVHQDFGRPSLPSDQQ